jgi:MoaA/NifB/PqqE/SkfB family radical SAM enzyme
MPILCNYYLTYRCNAYCAFCEFGNHEKFRGSGMAKREDVLRNLPALRRLGVRFIDFTGGEPLLHPDLPELLRAAQRCGMMTSVTSNGLLYPKRAKELKGVVDLLHFSLDAAGRDEHDRSRGVPCFDAVRESVEIALAQGDHPDLIFTATEENYRDLDRLWQWTRPRKLLLLINPIFSHINDFRLSPEALSHLGRIARRPFVYLNPAFLRLRRQGGNDPDRPLCRAVSRVVVISPDNELLLPCYHFHNEKIPIGTDLRAAHRSDRVNWHRDHEGRHDFCRGCTVNCYFEPSFAYPFNGHSLAAVPSKLRYAWYKYVRRNAF